MNKSGKYLLFFGISADILVLGYYKYTDFLITNINGIFNTHFNLQHIILPLAISFFTFQQISYLVDTYRGQVKQHTFLDYALFIVFFPQLIAGPIVRHNEMMPQFADLSKKTFDWENFCRGMFLFITGLGKKVLIADSVAHWVSMGYANYAHLSTIEAWIVILSYTFQIYYDFSGYTDMALGIGKMFNIELPQNFNNPYKATSVEEFWQKWHMSLTRFLRDYVYIPLGGNRKTLVAEWIRGGIASYLNIIIVFFISGLWHGASWMFIIWGMLHGIANAINKFLRLNKIKTKCPWILTFLFINISWVFFRSDNWIIAKGLLLNAFGANGTYWPKVFHTGIKFNGVASTIEYGTVALIVLCILIISIFFPRFSEWNKNFHPNIKYFSIAFLIFIASLAVILIPDLESPFIYFNF